jgi:prepilin-type N-terminal cleavage/methylation domain-containing protein
VTLSTAQSKNEARALRAFTLIELIAVMAILTITFSIAAPALSNFFRGRTIESEARRLLSLTREGQSRAVSEGVPMDLWVDTAKSAYGLCAEPSYEPQDAKAETISLESGVEIEMVSLTGKSITAAVSANSSLSSALGGTMSTPPLVSAHPDLPTIRFLPDGTISDTSPEMLRLTKENETLFIVQSLSRMYYEIRTSSN